MKKNKKNRNKKIAKILKIRRKARMMSDKKLEHFYDLEKMYSFLSDDISDDDRENLSQLIDCARNEYYAAINDLEKTGAYTGDTIMIF